MEPGYKTDKELEKLAKRMNNVRKLLQFSESKIGIIRRFVKNVYDVGFWDGRNSN